MKKTLFGYSVYLTDDFIPLLINAGYNSIVSDRILYGPLQYANHQCHERVGLRLESNGLFRLKSDYELVQEFGNPFTVGKEVTINYNVAELGFKCECAVCRTVQLQQSLK